MKVLTKHVVIEEKEFYLISDVHEDQKYYGTIPYENTKDGVLIKGMNGAQMCISFNSIPEALENRRRDILLNRILDKYESSGLSRQEAVYAMLEDPEYHALYA